MSLQKISEQHYQEENQQSSLASVDGAPIVSSYNDRIRPLLDTVESSTTPLDGTIGEDLNTERQADWRKLPTDLLAAIAKSLTEICDYISFRGVCISWRSAATFANFYRAFPRVPWLMYASEKKEEKGQGKEILGDDIRSVTNFFDLQSKTLKIADFSPAVGVPYLSWSGWILDASNDCVDVNLTHPIWRIRIELPGLDTFPAYERGQDEKSDNRVIKKMVLSSSPTIKTDLLVMVIWGGKNQLGFFRPGDASWTIMASWDGSFCDIIYRNGRLYAVDCRLRVVECDVHGPNPTQIRQVFILPGIDHDKWFDGVINYLVELSGKFLIVCRRPQHFKKFRIFEFNLMDGSYNEIQDLGNRALFLGCNSSICVELSAWSKVKPNHIYFTDNIGPSKFGDMGIYDLSSKTIKGFYVGSGFIHAPSTWVVPSF